MAAFPAAVGLDHARLDACRLLPAARLVGGQVCGPARLERAGARARGAAGGRVRAHDGVAAAPGGAAPRGRHLAGDRPARAQFRAVCRATRLRRAGRLFAADRGHDHRRAHRRGGALVRPAERLASRCRAHRRPGRGGDHHHGRVPAARPDEPGAGREPPPRGCAGGAGAAGARPARHHRAGHVEREPAAPGGRPGLARGRRPGESAAGHDGQPGHARRHPDGRDGPQFVAGAQPRAGDRRRLRRHSRPRGPVRRDGDRYALPESTAMTLLRIVQGALANVAEHAQAQTAAVTLSYLPDEVRLDVVDDGVGFDPAQPPAGPGRGFGLEAIGRRAELAGGRVTVESEPGRGAAIAVAIPTEGASS
ncbi:MAG: hypothetical protein HOV71_15645 [Hamadaea sp.]|nr:hypothetical protein [Hamadaea sp.]NUT06211.1 hypothetical protein [Hamadaea sp.]